MKRVFGNKTAASAALTTALTVNVIFLLLFHAPLHAATEVLKTSKVLVGSAAPLAGSVKDAHERGKAVLLVLFSNPIQCRDCDKVDEAAKESASKYGAGIEYIGKGGGDMLGATDEETVTLKKLYGFVTMGEAWTFVIDRDGILRKIFIGAIAGVDFGAILGGLPAGAK